MLDDSVYYTVLQRKIVDAIPEATMGLTLTELSRKMPEYGFREMKEALEGLLKEHVIGKADWDIEYRFYIKTDYDEIDIRDLSDQCFMLDITQEDINEGITQCDSKCAVALAVKRTFNYMFGYDIETDIFHQSIMFAFHTDDSVNAFKFETDEDVFNWMNNFDNSKGEAEPVEIDLNVIKLDQKPHPMYDNKIWRIYTGEANIA